MMALPTQEPIQSPVMSRSRITVLINSEVRLLGEGLAFALAREAALSVCGCCDTLADTLAKIPRLQPDIVLLNVSLSTGIDAIRQIRDVAPPVRIVALAVADDPVDVIAWAEAGAVGYIASTAGLDEVVPLLSNIMRGEQPCSGRVAAGLLQRLHDIARVAVSPSACPSAAPTIRELQIVEMIATGLSNKEIALRLNISLATTKSHVHNLLGKLGVQRRGQVASWMNHRKTSAGAAFRPPTEA
jgi:DNA-binding NarL/FixJ family response regulator